MKDRVNFYFGYNQGTKETDIFTESGISIDKIIPIKTGFGVDDEGINVIFFNSDVFNDFNDIINNGTVQWENDALMFKDNKTGLYYITNVLPDNYIEQIKKTGDFIMGGFQSGSALVHYYAIEEPLLCV